MLGQNKRSQTANTGLMLKGDQPELLQMQSVYNIGLCLHPKPCMKQIPCHKQIELEFSHGQLIQCFAWGPGLLLHTAARTMLPNGVNFCFTESHK